MRISDWSSDVCSSDLHPKNGTNYKKYDNAGKPFEHGAAWQSGRRFVKMVCGSTPSRRRWQQPFVARQAHHSLLKFFERTHFDLADTFARSEERRVGKECVSPCRSRGSPDH